MKKALTVLIMIVLLLPAMFIMINPHLAEATERTITYDTNYFELFDADRDGLPIERDISYNLMDYSPTYYNWFDITTEYTSFPTLGDPTGNGTSTTDTGEIPLVPLNSSIDAEDIYTMFSIDNSVAQSTYILYHDDDYIYSAIVSNSLYSTVLEYHIDSTLASASQSVLRFMVIRDEGTSSNEIIYADCRDDFIDVHFSSETLDVKYYREVLDKHHAVFFVWLPSISSDEVLNIEIGESIEDSVSDRAMAYNSPTINSLAEDGSIIIAYDMETSKHGSSYDPPSEPSRITYPNGTITVGASGADFTTVSAAITAATSGQVIDILDYQETTSTITVNKNLRFVSSTGEGAIEMISGTSSDYAISFSAGYTVEWDGVDLYSSVTRGMTAYGTLFWDSGNVAILTTPNLIMAGGGATKMVVSGGEFIGYFIPQSGYLWMNGGALHSQLSMVSSTGGYLIINGVEYAATAPIIISSQGVGGTVYLIDYYSQSTGKSFNADATGGTVYIYPQLFDKDILIPSAETDYVFLQDERMVGDIYDGEEHIEYVLNDCSNAGDFTLTSPNGGDSISSDGSNITVSLVSGLLRTIYLNTTVTVHEYTTGIDAPITLTSGSTISGDYTFRLYQDPSNYYQWVVPMVDGYDLFELDFDDATIVGSLSFPASYTFSIAGQKAAGTTASMIIEDINGYYIKQNDADIQPQTDFPSIVAQPTEPDFSGGTTLTVDGVGTDINTYATFALAYASASNYDTIQQEIDEDVTGITTISKHLKLTGNGSLTKTDGTATEVAMVVSAGYNVVFDGYSLYNDVGACLSVKGIAFIDSGTFFATANQGLVCEGANGRIVVNGGEIYGYGTNHLMTYTNAKIWINGGTIHSTNVNVLFSYGDIYVSGGTIGVTDTTSTAIFNARYNAIHLFDYVQLSPILYQVIEGNMYVYSECSDLPYTKSDIGTGTIYIATIPGDTAGTSVAGNGTSFTEEYGQYVDTLIFTGYTYVYDGSLSENNTDYVGSSLTGNITIGAITSSSVATLYYAFVSNMALTPGQMTTIESELSLIVNDTEGMSNIKAGSEFSFQIIESEILEEYEGNENILFYGFPVYSVSDIINIRSSDQLQVIIESDEEIRCYEGCDYIVSYYFDEIDTDVSFDDYIGFTTFGFYYGPSDSFTELGIFVTSDSNVTYLLDWTASSSMSYYQYPSNFLILDDYMNSGLGGYIYAVQKSSIISTYRIVKCNMISHLGASESYVFEEVVDEPTTVATSGPSIIGEGAYLLETIAGFSDYYNISFTKNGLVNVNINAADDTGSIYNNYTFNYFVSGLGEGRTFFYDSGDQATEITNYNGTATYSINDIIDAQLLALIGYMDRFVYFDSDNYLVSSENGILVRALSLPHVIIDYGDDINIVFESNYRFITMEYGDSYFFNFGDSVTIITNDTMVQYYFTDDFVVNTIRIVSSGNDTGWYINGIAYFEAEFDADDTLNISCIQAFDYSLYNSSEVEFFDTSYLKLSGTLYSETIASITESDFAEVDMVIGDFISGRFDVTMGDITIDCRRDGLTYRFIVDGNEITFRSTNRNFLVTLVKEYEEFTLTVIPITIQGSDYTIVGNPIVLSWNDINDYPMDSLTLSYNAAEARIYQIALYGQRTTVYLHDKILTDQSNNLTGDGINLYIGYWDESTTIYLGQYEFTRSGNVISVYDTIGNETETVAYRINMTITWDDGLSVNGITLFNVAGDVEDIEVVGYLRIESAFELDIATETVDIVAYGGNVVFDVEAYGAYVFILSLISLGGIGFVSSRMGYGWMDLIEIYGVLIFILLFSGAMMI